MIPQSEYLGENIVILALQNQMGNVTLAAAELGLTHYDLVMYMGRHPDVLEAKNTIRAAMREALKDEAEDLLVAKMRSDNSLLIFYLKTQVKERGYDTSKGSVVNNNKVEVNVDARSLIAAMRNGTKLIDVEAEREEDVIEEGELFQLPELLSLGE